MADAIVSVVLEQLTSEIYKKLREEVRLVTGVRKEINTLTSNFLAIQDVLHDAEQKQVQERAVRRWLDQLKDASYDMDDVLDEWNTAILKLQGGEVDQNAIVPEKKVCSFFPSPRFGFCLKRVGLRRDIARKIKDINKNLDSIVKQKDMFILDKNTSNEEPREPTSSFDVIEMHGRDKEKSDLVNKLLSESKEAGNAIPVISIVGMAGIGKTTLAQFAYNEVKSKFEKRIWVCVSNPFNKIRVAQEIIAGLDGQVPDLINFDSLLNCIHKSVEGKKFILVLDDVWTEEDNKWGPLYNSLNNGDPESKILVTTRNKRVALAMNSVDFFLEKLSDDKSWLLFEQLAFSGKSQQERENLAEIGRQIVGKCKGLPLAIKTVGSLLRFKESREQWIRILDSETWKLEALEYVFRPLFLSYNDLSSTVKRCFLYCVVFPKDYIMKKDELIKLWMAQDYLGLDRNKELEITGEEYFHILSVRSFFQDFEKDDANKIVRCKMHDIVHDFGQFLVKNECFTMGTSNDGESSLSRSYENARHLKLILNNKEASFPTYIRSMFKLRSLFVERSFEDSSSISNCLPSLFKQLTCLRALELCEDWTNNPITRIPSEIGKLIHLRYLNMSRLTGIKKLPETLCELYNLQTLNLSHCWKLEKLPEGMGKLINLRHLINDETYAWSYMPKGIEKLVCLRTLSKLVVGGDGHNSQVCSLDCLKKLDYLRGSLEIRRLGNVIDGAEAKNANLKSKKYLLDLKLYFDYRSEASSTEVSTKDEAVLEALHAPPNLERLIVKGYRGITMSFDWMGSLTQLRKLTLEDCINCEHLPPLGKLPLLQTLVIKGMRVLKRVGNEFLGIKNNDPSSSSSSLIVFPKLNRLVFEELENWEDWEYEIKEDIAIMPCLSYCEIDRCPKLKALPNHFLQATSLEKLDISDCPVLKQWAEIYLHLRITSDREDERDRLETDLEYWKNR